MTGIVVVVVVFIQQQQQQQGWIHFGKAATIYNIEKKLEIEYIVMTNKKHFIVFVFFFYLEK